MPFKAVLKRSQLKRSVKSALASTRALDVLSRLVASRRVDIMLYHGFCKGSDRDTRFPGLMPVARFEEHLRIFTKYGNPLRLDDVLGGAGNGVAITFDDGYASNYELAFPVLERYQFPATIFVTTGFVDQSTPLWGDWLEFLIMAAPRRDSEFDWKNGRVNLPLASSDGTQRVIVELKQFLRGTPIEKTHDFLRALEAHLDIRYRWEDVPQALRPLSWGAIREMRRSGLVSIGAHTVSHPVLARCAEEVQRVELLKSKQRIEQELDQKCVAFAYPYGKQGDYTAVTKQAVRDAGFEFGVSAESGYNTADSDRYELKRWGADINLSDLAYLASGGPAVAAYFGRHAS